MELLGSSPIPRSFVACCVCLYLRPLPSTGITRLHRSYEPLRHPIRPGLSLASCQLIATTITAGASRVASGLLCVHAIAITPAGPMKLVRSSISIVCGLPCVTVRSAPAIIVSGACSAFTHVMACTVGESPCVHFHRKAPTASLPPLPLRLLPGGANQFPGGSCTRCSPAPFTAHYYASYPMSPKFLNLTRSDCHLPTTYFRGTGERRMLRHQVKYHHGI